METPCVPIFLIIAHLLIYHDKGTHARIPVTYKVRKALATECGEALCPELSKMTEMFYICAVQRGGYLWQPRGYRALEMWLVWLRKQTLILFCLNVIFKAI